MRQGPHRIVSSCPQVSGRADERVAEARFKHVEVTGSVYFRWVGSHSRAVAGDTPRGDPDTMGHTDTLILTDLYRAPPPNATRSRSPVIMEHDWKIYVTDILDSESGGRRSAA